MMNTELDYTNASKPVVRIVSDITAESPEQDPALLYLSVTALYPRYMEEGGRRNVFVAVRRNDVQALMLALQEALEREDQGGVPSRSGADHSRTASTPGHQRSGSQPGRS